MPIHYPNSFLKLLLISFAFAILPLMLAFVNANMAFDVLTQKSQTTISNAVAATRASLVLQEQLHLMERSAKQYFVLGDAELLSNYTNSRTSFMLAAQQLTVLSQQPHQQMALKELQRKELALYAQINYQQIQQQMQSQQTQPSNQTSTLSNAHAMDFLEGFSTLTAHVDTIIQENNINIDQTSQQLALASAQAQSRFFWLSLILIPFALLVTGVTAVMLGRPIQRMDTAIKDLGKGEYQRAIAIDGPGDLKVLGQRLDWLRLELLQLKEQKQRFMQHISHELKTPLTAIREAAELLADGVGGSVSTQQQEIIDILRDNSLRLQKMIENLLTFTKLEAHKPLTLHQLVDIPSMVSAVLAAHALSIRNKNLHMTTHFSHSTLICDTDKLTLILDNLISNAVKYTPQDGAISIVSKSDKQWHTLAVKDNGPGLSEQDIAQLFDPFYQGKTLHQGLVSSSGLGLNIAKHLAESLGGTIDLIEAEVGAHFVVRLPKIGV